MAGLEADTIGGFNGMIKKQKKEAGKALVSTILFDDYSEVLHDRVDINKIEEMTDREYYVRGCTALLDAVGGAISHVKSVRSRMKKENRPEKTIFIITTDGCENSSREYSYNMVSKMIRNCREDNWEFIFLGANIDAVKEAGRLGIQASRAVNYKCDKKGTELNYKVLGNVVSRMRACGSAVEMNNVLDEEECFAEIHADYAARG